MKHSATKIGRSSFEHKKFDPFYLGRMNNLNHDLRLKNLSNAFSHRVKTQKMKGHAIKKKAFDGQLKDPFSTVPKLERDIPGTVSMQISDNGSPVDSSLQNAFSDRLTDSFKLYGKEREYN